MGKKQDTTKAVAIADMPINEKAILTVDQKKALVRILEEEFDRQSTRYDVVRQERREQAMETYRKKVGYYKLKSELDSIRSKEKTIISRIENLGLEESGSRKTWYSDDRPKMLTEQKQAEDRLNNILKVCETPYNAHQKKAKVVSRLWLATTYAEAMVILREVLGNGDIPPVKAVTFQPAE